MRLQFQNANFMAGGYSQRGNQSKNFTSRTNYLNNLNGLHKSDSVNFTSNPKAKLLEKANNLILGDYKYYSKFYDYLNGLKKYNDLWSKKEKIESNIEFFTSALQRIPEKKEKLANVAISSEKVGDEKGKIAFKLVHSLQDGIETNYKMNIEELKTELNDINESLAAYKDEQKIIFYNKLQL